MIRKNNGFILNIQRHADDGEVVAPEGDVKTVLAPQGQQPNPQPAPPQSGENVITNELPKPDIPVADINVEELVKKYLGTYTKQFQLKEQEYQAKISELESNLTNIATDNKIIKQQKQKEMINVLNNETEAKQALFDRIAELERTAIEDKNREYITSMVTADPDLAPVVKKLNIKTIDQFKTIILPMKDDLKRLAELEKYNTANGNNNIFDNSYQYGTKVNPQNKTEIELQALEEKYLKLYSAN